MMALRCWPYSSAMVTPRRLSCWRLAQELCPSIPTFSHDLGLHLTDSSLILAIEHNHPVRPGDDGRVGDADEEAALHHARDQLQSLVQRLRLGDAAERAVEDEVAAVGDERLAVRPHAQRDL